MILNILISIANIILIIVLMPTVLNKKAYIPLITSIPTTVSLFIFAFVFFAELLYAGAIMETISAILWLVIAITKH